jgi:hypothetical protein
MAESPSTAALALPLRAVNVSSPDGWNFGWCAVDANNRIIGYCMTEAQAKQLVAPFAHADSATPADYEEVLADHRRLVRELDVLLNGEEGAAPQASLCDIVMQVKKQGLRSAELAPYKTVEAMRSDAALGQQCEGLIALKTHFTGEPPYVGNEGVLRALREALDELTRLRAMFAAATDVQGDDEVLKYVTSGNAIPVTRCTVSADLIRQLVARSAVARSEPKWNAWAVQYTLSCSRSVEATIRQSGVARRAITRRLHREHRRVRFLNSATVRNCTTGNPGRSFRRPRSFLGGV